MDLVIWLIELLFNALSKEKRAKPAAPGAPVTPRGLPAPGRSQPPNLTSAAQDPAFDDGGWRVLVAVLGIIMLIAMVAVWFVYTQVLLR